MTIVPKLCSYSVTQKMQKMQGELVKGHGLSPQFLSLPEGPGTLLAVGEGIFILITTLEIIS